MLLFLLAGVLLLNATLTVRASEAKSHSGQGWENLTDAVIKEVWRINYNVLQHLYQRLSIVCLGECSLQWYRVSVMGCPCPEQSFLH